jgi:hypothetical protein
MKNQMIKAPIEATSKKPYLSAKLTRIKIDNEISLVMSSESQVPPPEFIRLLLLVHA